MKKMQVVMIGLLLLFVSSAYAADEWTTQDIALEATWLVLHVLDYGTTLDIANQPDKYWEINPILGRHPSREWVHAYMIGSAILHPVITHFLPKKVSVLGFDFPARTAFQAVSIGMSGGLVINNFSIGLHLAF